jgi:hypothetical protein
MAGGLPSKYIAIVFLGNGVAGIFCNILRAITLVTFPVTEGDPKAETNGFDSALCFYIMILCSVLQVMLARNKFAIYYLDWTKNPRSKQVN